MRTFLILFQICADVHRKGKKSHKEELKRKINTMSQIALQMVALSVSKGNNSGEKEQVEWNIAVHPQHQQHA